MSTTLRTGGSPDELKKRVSSRSYTARSALTRTALAKAKKAWPDKKFELVRLSLSMCTRFNWSFCEDSVARGWSETYAI